MRTIFFSSLRSWIGTPLLDSSPILASATSNIDDDLEAFALEAGIVGQRKAEVAGAHHRDAQLAIEAEDLAQVALAGP